MENCQDHHILKDMHLKMPENLKKMYLCTLHLIANFHDDYRRNKEPY